jgi:hypothetical protein
VSLLQRKGFVKVIFDGDWAADGLDGVAWKLGSDHQIDIWRSEDIGHYTGMCVASLYRRYHSVGVSISLGDNNYRAFAEKLSGPTEKVALVYDPSEFETRWLTDPITGEPDPTRKDSSMDWILKQKDSGWEGWKDWFKSKGFKLFDITGAIRLAELTDFADELIRGLTSSETTQMPGEGETEREDVA